MKTLYRPKHFDVRELVPPEAWAALGDGSIILLDGRIVNMADCIRDYFGRPVTINNWHTGGERVASGFRGVDCKIGAPYSQHRFGRALDLLVSGIPAENARREVIRERGLFRYVTAMEAAVSWVHIDCRGVAEDEIYLFNG